MPFYILDTNTCIYIMGQKFGVEIKAKDAGYSNCFVPEAVVAELYYGVYKSKSFEDNYKTLQSFLSGITTIETGYILESFGETKAFLASTGNKISDFDILIACTGLLFDTVVVTNNTKHFIRIPGLKLEDWTKS